MSGRRTSCGRRSRCRNRRQRRRGRRWKRSSRGGRRGRSWRSWRSTTYGRSRSQNGRRRGRSWRRRRRGARRGVPRGQDDYHHPLSAPAVLRHAADEEERTRTVKRERRRRAPSLQRLYRAAHVARVVVRLRHHQNRVSSSPSAAAGPEHCVRTGHAPPINRRTEKEEID